MKPNLLIYLFIILMSGCCNKKACPGDELPRIVVKIPTMVNDNETVTLYQLDMGKRDSAFFQVMKTEPFFSFFPLNDYDDPGLGSRQFVIRHGNRIDTIQHITGVFRNDDIVCDGRWGCGRGFGNNKTTVKKLVDFSFLVRSKKFGVGDTLNLD